MNDRLVRTASTWWQYPRNRGVAVASALAVCLCFAPSALARPPEEPLKITVDARDLPRKLLHSRITIPCKPGKLALWFPKWLPGTHEACGPIQNIAGLRIQGANGILIPWRRDELEMFRFLCEAPPGSNSIDVTLDLICNEPAILASAHLSYGTHGVGVLNWSNCLIYPEGPSCDKLEAILTLILPEDWQWASAMEPASSHDHQVEFKPVSLFELADRPLVAGRYLRSIKLDAGKGPPAYLDLVSDTPEAIKIKPAVAAAYGRVVREAQALLGACPYTEYHFLTTCSDTLGYFGLEHRSSSLNGVGSADLIDETRLHGWVANLLPHEYAHAWCGKFRRPAGMCTPNFHTPFQTSLLWVYEGLDEYLGELLAVRSGLTPPSEYRRGLASTISHLSHITGRKWRSLEDTSISSSMLRAASPNWTELRRGQDYYSEGMLFWLEADAVIREKTHGSKSLDDFCRTFLGPNSSAGDVIPYDEAEVVKRLQELADFPWKDFIDRRIHKPMDTLPLDLVGKLGYKLDYTDQAWTRSNRRGPTGIDALDSLGAAFGEDGSILTVVPDMVLDQAKLAPGMHVIGVNGKVFSRDQLHQSLADSKQSHKIELLVAIADNLKTVVLPYSGGVRHLALVRDPARPDVLSSIIKPRALKSTAQAPNPDPSPSPKGYVCGRANTPITIDGKLDEEAWKQAPWTDLFVDIEGEVRPRPRFETRAKMLWDDIFFYIAGAIKDPHVWATLTKHDSVIFQDNDFEIFIDPDGDNHEYYEIEINALGTEWDLFLKKPYRDGGPAINEWEIPGLKTAVAVQGTINNPTDSDQGWTVEFAIPWKVLAEYAHRPTPPRDGDQWRVNFSRVEWRHIIKDGKYQKVPNTHEDNWVWSPQGAIDMHRPERWGFVQFSEKPPGQAAYHPDPATPTRDRLMAIYHAQRSFHNQHQRWAASLDELGLKDANAQGTTLTLTPQGYRAEIKGQTLSGATVVWSIEQDSRIQSR